MKKIVTIPTTGTLDKDSDLLFIQSESKGNMPALVDMEFSDQQQGVLQLRTAKGNVAKIDPGVVVKQNQRVRIYWDSVNQPTTISLSLFNVNDQQISGGLPRTTDGGLIQFKAAIVSIVQVEFLFAATFAHETDTEPFIDVELDVQFSDWYLIPTGCTYKVIQEAISNTGAGTYKPIGSFDLLGTQFYWLTTQRNLKTQINSVTSAVGNAFGRTEVRIPAHGLSNFDTIAINAVVGATGVNGIWVIKIIDNFHVELQASIFGGVYESGGTVFKDTYGYGCIGVAVENITAGTFAFTPLLRSTKLNFNTKREIYNPQIELAGEVISMYYTDNYNLPRCTYYRGPFETDGCIEALFPKGQYDYLTLTQELALQSNYSGYEFTFLEQGQSQGNLFAGNYRYAFRFIAESGNASQVSLMTNPIPVYASPYLVPTDIIYGNHATVLCPKINRLSLTGISPGVFKFVELIAFWYQGSAISTVAVSAVIVRREPLSEDQTSITLEHNGNEVSIVNLDAGLANQVQQDIIRVRDLTIMQNRLVPAGITTSPQYDLTDLAKTLTYSIRKFPVFGAFDAQTFYEFYNPEAVVNRPGYQAWEWERYYLVGELLSGNFTQSTFAFDVRFVSQADYIGTYGPDEFMSTNGYDRRDMSDDTFTDYDLNENTRDFLQYFIRVKGLNWNYQIEGVPIKRIFKSFKIFKAERRSEVLASGAIQLGQIALPDGTFASATAAYDNIFATGGVAGAFNNYNAGSFHRRNRRIGSFYGPDFLFSNNTMDNTTANKLLVFGQYKTITIHTAPTTEGQSATISQAIYSSEDMSNSAAFYDIVESRFMNGGEAATVGGQAFKKQIDANTTGTISDSANGYVQSSFVISTVNEIENNCANFDRAFYQSLIFRPLKDKFGSTTSNNVVSFTGATIPFDETDVDVFGGDVFCQQTWVKNHLTVNKNADTIGAGGYNIISSNRVNTNLRVWTLGSTEQVFPVSTQSIVTWLQTTVFDTIVQNSGYKITNNVQANVVYDPNNQDNGIYLTRVIYSELKPNGSKVDFYRIILPVNFQDQPQLYGPISRVLNVNNNLFIVCERGYIQAYFNSRGQLVSPDQGQILIGDGSVLSRVGNNLTQYGTDHSGAVTIGKSQSGKDVVYFLSPVFSEFLRFGDDGLVSKSRMDSMRTFFNNNLKWAQNAKTPADGYGITAVWDNNNKQVIFTVKAWKQVQDWSSAVFYNVGAEVLSGFGDQGVPQIWIATGSNQDELPGTGLNWQAVSFADLNYYNLYTFTYSELKQGFTQFFRFVPNHYTRWDGTYLSSQPDLESPDSGIQYQHSIGPPAQWYGVDYPGGEISIVCNWARDLDKKFASIGLNGSTKPEYVTVTSLFRDDENGEIIQQSYLEEGDFDIREGQIIAGIKSITGPNGTNDEDTGQIEGLWLRLDIRFPSGKVATLTNVNVYLRTSKQNVLMVQ